MTNAFKVPLGYPTSSVYFAKYDEDLFHRFSDDEKQDCYEYWTKAAKEHGCKEAILQLIPDPIFPSGEKTIPYIAWRAKTEEKPDVGYTVVAEVRVLLTEPLTPKIRARIETELASYPRGTSYKILREDGETEAWGKVR